MAIRVLLMNGRVNLRNGSTGWLWCGIVSWRCRSKGLSRVIASVINVTMRCWEMPQPIGGSNGGAWGQTWRFICGPFVRKHVDDRRCWNRKKGHQFQSVSHNPLHSLSRTVCFGTWLWRALKPLSQFSPQWVGGCGSVQEFGFVALASF